MPLMTATSTFGSGEDTGVLLNSVIYTVSVTELLMKNIKTSMVMQSDLTRLEVAPSCLSEIPKDFI